MKTVIIVQARMTSTRLPGKVLKEVLGKPLLAYQLERLRRVQLADEIVLATTTNQTDDILAAFAAKEEIRCYRGDEQDVLARYYQAAVMAEADVVVRVTSDCPLLDPAIVDDVIRSYQQEPATDYVSNTLTRTYPRGLDVECFSFEALERAYHEANELYQREHVTPYLYQNPRLFTVKEVKGDADYSFHRWTVDTAEDFQLICLLLETMSVQAGKFSWLDILTLLEQHPEWTKINAHIEQKKITEVQERQSK